MEEINRQRAINAWVMYDWASSAFSVIMAVVLPIYYESVAGKDLPGNTATVYWGYTTSAALAIAALLSPVLGAMGDFLGAKKRYLTRLMLFGVLGTGLLYFAGEGDWLMASIFFIVGNVGFSLANVFYDALLPHVADPDEVDQVSAKGFALGYLGGSLPLIACGLIVYLIEPGVEQEWIIRPAFVSAAVWWLAFTIPLWRNVPEPARRLSPGEEGLNPIRAGFGRLRDTFKEIAKYRDLLFFLAATWLYGDGIGTLIRMGAIYATEIGISQTMLIATLVTIQVLSVPFSLAFGWLAKKIQPKRALYVGLGIYTLISIGGYFVRTDLHFLLMGSGIAVVQGGTQALTRSLGARLVPKSRSAEFYGFFSVSVKFAGIAGPFIFALIGQLAGDSRLSVLAISLFFISGWLLLSRVNVERGIRVAEEEEARNTG